MTVTSYAVTGMTCGHCEGAVRSAVAALPGVTDIAVSAASGSLVVTSDAAIDDAAILEAVDEAGYRAERV